MLVKNVIHYRNISTTNCFKLPEEIIPYYDFTFMLDGEMEYCINGKKVVLQKDDAFLLPPGTLRSRDEKDRPIHYASFNFHADDMDSSLELYMPKCINSDIKKVVSTLPVDHLTHEPYTRQKCIHLLSYILLEIAHNRNVGCKNSHILYIMQYVDEHITEKLTLSEIAHSIHLSKEYTSAIFSKETGKSISEYINEQKISVASELIKTTDMSLGDIALYLGFESYNYFSRLFKKYYNVSAIQYKKNARLR